MMGHILDGLLGALFGMLITRYFMAPSFCPRCLQVKQWQEDFDKALKKEKEGK